MICKDCGETKDTEFYQSNKSTCKKCLVKYAEKWWKQHPSQLVLRNQKKIVQRRLNNQKWYQCNGRNRAPNYANSIYLWQKRHPEAIRARLLLKRDIERKNIIKPYCCFLCNKECRVQAHHSDYSKPLEVIWLCASCHKKLHLGVEDVKVASN